jgi:hypothetical protein
MIRTTWYKVFSRRGWLKAQEHPRFKKGVIDPNGITFWVEMIR